MLNKSLTAVIDHGKKEILKKCCGTKRSNAIWAQITHKRIVDLSDSDKA